MIHFKYKDLQIGLTENGNYYKIYEYTPVMGQEHIIQSGAAPVGHYNLDYVKGEIDKLVLHESVKVLIGRRKLDEIYNLMLDSDSAYTISQIYKEELEHKDTKLALYEKKIEYLEEIIKEVIEDFNHEIGTPYYDKLYNKALELNIIK